MAVISTFLLVVKFEIIFKCFDITLEFALYSGFHCQGKEEGYFGGILKEGAESLPLSPKLKFHEQRSLLQKKTLFHNFKLFLNKSSPVSFHH